MLVRSTGHATRLRTLDELKSAKVASQAPRSTTLTTNPEQRASSTITFPMPGNGTSASPPTPLDPNDTCGCPCPESEIREAENRGKEMARKEMEEKKEKMELQVNKAEEGKNKALEDGFYVLIVVGVIIIMGCLYLKSNLEGCLSGCGMAGQAEIKRAGEKKTSGGTTSIFFCLCTLCCGGCCPREQQRANRKVKVDVCVTHTLTHGLDAAQEGQGHRRPVAANEYTRALQSRQSPAPTERPSLPAPTERRSASPDVCDVPQSLETVEPQSSHLLRSYHLHGEDSKRLNKLRLDRLK